MNARLCTSCLLPHETTDWYVIEHNHPRRGDIECAAAHERRIPIEVRDFGTGRPRLMPQVDRRRRPKRQADLLELITRQHGRRARLSNR